MTKKPILKPEQALTAALGNLDAAKANERLVNVMFGTFSEHTDTPNGAYHSLTFGRVAGNTVDSDRPYINREADRERIITEWRRTYYPTEAETVAAAARHDTQE